jgi:tRNA threonylcarbamoyladenosine modification (KEOPS) complex Cgi121 subunit
MSTESSSSSAAPETRFPLTHLEGEAASVLVMYFCSVNREELVKLRALCLPGEGGAVAPLPGAILDARAVVGLMPVLVAARTALRAQRAGALMSVSLNTEVVAALCPSNAVQNAIRALGVSEERASNDVLLVIVNAPEGAEERIRSELAHASSRSAVETNVQHLRANCDVARIARIYKLKFTSTTPLSSPELDLPRSSGSEDALVDAVLCRMALMAM